MAGTEVTFDIRNFFFGQMQLRGSVADDATDLKWGLEHVHVGRIKPALDRAKLNPPARPAPAARALASGIYEAVYLEGTHI